MREYDQWAAREGERLADEVRRDALRGDFSKRAFFVPAKPGAWASIVIAHECPPGASPLVLDRGRVGVGCIPYDAYPCRIRDACRDLPVYSLPVDGAALASAGEIAGRRGAPYPAYGEDMENTLRRPGAS